MHAQRLGEELRFEGRLSDRQREIAILCVAIHWEAAYEWWAHSRIAAAHGLEPAIIEAIRRCDAPLLTDESEKLICEFTRALLREHVVDDDLYGRTAAALGEGELVELVTLLGYYVMISMTLNVFRVDLPEGEKSPFAD